MPEAVYKLRIRDDTGGDGQWQEARVVAGSLAEALVQAQQRFGDDRVMAIEQDAAGEPPTDADLVVAPDAPGDEVAGTAPDIEDVPFELSVPEPRIVHPPPRAEVFVAAVATSDALGDDTITAREPMPWEGRWRPSVLLRIGAVAGLVLFAAWYQFGAPSREQFVTAAPASTDRAQGLALEDQAPRGGVLAATGLPVRRGDDTVALGTVVGEAISHFPRDEESPIDEQALGTDDPAIRAIGTLVGEMFSRMPDESDMADPPPYRNAQSYEPVGDAQASVPASSPYVIASREPSVLRPFFVGVDRGGGVMETLRVSAYDADHARQIVASLPERPVILRGPTTRLDW